LPRIDPSTERLLAGGDGLGTWERLAANIGRKDDAEGDFADRMLREWIYEYLTEAGHDRMSSPGVNISDGELSFDTGTVLISSKTKPFLLESQYLHKAIFVVMQQSNGVMAAIIVNRPTILGVSFYLPAKDKSSRTASKTRVSFGGEIQFGGTTMLLHHKRELGGSEIGGSGLFVAGDDFSGEANDLMAVSGLLAWLKPADLERQIQKGDFTVVPNGKVPWERIWELTDVSAQYATSLEERIADVKRKEEGGDGGELEVLQNRAARMTRRSCEVWESVISEQAAPSLQQTSRREGSLMRRS